MRRAAFLLLALVPLVVFAPVSVGDAPPVDKPIAYRGARILTADGPPIMPAARWRAWIASLPSTPRRR